MFKKRRRATKKKIDIPTRYVLIGLLLFCTGIMFISLNFNISGGPLKSVSESVFGPMQKGLNYIGSYMVNQKEKITKDYSQHLLTLQLIFTQWDNIFKKEEETYLKQ